MHDTRPSLGSLLLPLQPANVFLGAGGTTAKLGDIGLAAMDGLQRGGEK